MVNTPNLRLLLATVIIISVENLVFVVEEEVIVILLSLGKCIRTEDTMKISVSLKEIYRGLTIKSQLQVLHLVMYCETYHHQRFWTGVRK
jgi:hypothetical protein